jgi:hypothetical protein
VIVSNTSLPSMNEISVPPPGIRDGTESSLESFGGCSQPQFGRVSWRHAVVRLSERSVRHHLRPEVDGTGPAHFPLFDSLGALEARTRWGIPLPLCGIGYGQIASISNGSDGVTPVIPLTVTTRRSTEPWSSRSFRRLPDLRVTD